jgi:coenzyme F420-reducing hydrogenase delta subunit
MKKLIFQVVKKVEGLVVLQQRKHHQEYQKQNERNHQKIRNLMNEINSHRLQSEQIYHQRRSHSDNEYLYKIVEQILLQEKKKKRERTD